MFHLRQPEKSETNTLLLVNDYTIGEKKEEMETQLDNYTNYLFSKEFSDSEISDDEKTKILFEISRLINELKLIYEMPIISINQTIKTNFKEFKSKTNEKS